MKQNNISFVTIVTSSCTYPARYPGDRMTECREVIFETGITFD